MSGRSPVMGWKLACSNVLQRDADSTQAPDYKLNLCGRYNGTTIRFATCAVMNMSSERSIESRDEDPATMIALCQRLTALYQRFTSLSYTRRTR